MRQFSVLSEARPENWRITDAGKRTHYAKLDGAMERSGVVADNFA